MGARPRHRQGRDRDRNPAEPDGPTGTFLEVSYDCAPPDLHQVQPFPLSQCVAGGVRTQEHTAHTHTGNGSHTVHTDGLFCGSTNCVCPQRTLLGNSINPCALKVTIIGTIEHALQT